ncbi:unnamed protein product [Clavelina lepadiformis]|uniref:Uncharacterized protein n=1 Tax=Clavelina lepadiformis TaxID=159417 RepID=A0ABP0GEE1_CLALP
MTRMTMKSVQTYITLSEPYGVTRTLQLRKQETSLKPLTTVTYKRLRTLGNILINYREVAHQTVHIKREQSLFKPYGQCALRGNHGKHLNMVIKTTSTPSPMGLSTLINLLLIEITMKGLSLRGNNFGNDGASHISTCLSKIEELYICQCNINASGIKSISDAISKLPEPPFRLVRAICTVWQPRKTHKLGHQNDIYPATKGIIHLNHSLTCRDYGMYVATANATSFT